MLEANKGNQKKKRKKKNGFVAREYFYRELSNSWSHNKAPYAYFEQLVLRARFWKALVTFLDRNHILLVSVCYLAVLSSKLIKNDLKCKQNSLPGSAITGTFEKWACK